MSRVITFSRSFPCYHPRKGEQTYFVEKIWAGLADITDRMMPSISMDFYKYYNCKFPKWHTIRSGNKWKVGDTFSPRVWSGKPYASKQESITEDIEIKKIWDFEMDLNGIYSINGKYLLSEEQDNKEIELAINDGLDPSDFFKWFMPNYNKPREFKGQIICWNENIVY